MQVERETVIEAAVSVGGVAAFIAAVIVVGLEFGGQTFSETGALALVAVILGFIVVMTLIGYWLSRQE